MRYDQRKEGALLLIPATGNENCVSVTTYYGIY